jgi:predicted ester cyclase
VRRPTGRRTGAEELNPERNKHVFSRAEQADRSTIPPPRQQGLPAGPDGLRELFRTFGAIDQTWTIDDIIAEGDKVVARATNRCEQESFLGVASHGRRQTFSAIFIHRIADGTIVETWRNADDLGRLLQLGARIEPATSTP